MLSEYANLELGDLRSEGNRYFLMALTQDLYKPLKIELLKHAAEHNNVLAALFLGNIYSSGLSIKGKLVVEKDCDKAFKAYNSIRNFDKYVY